MDRKHSLRVVAEAHRIMSEAEAKANQNPSSVRELDLMGQKFTWERYGSCIFLKYRLLRDGKEFYVLERDETEKRFEQFFGVVARTYHGDKYSFCEYMDVVRAFKRLPTIKELVQSSFEKDVAEMYDNYMKRILKR